jgi:ubiquinone biosynthesis protein COQ4
MVTIMSATMTTAAMPVSPSTPSLSRRAVLAAGAIARLSRQKDQLDQVLVLTQAINAGSISRTAERLDATEDGRRLLHERPRIDRTHVSYAALRALPDGTLGREYARFLDDNEITPDAFEELPNVVDERVAWTMLRLRQTHDLWHVLTGFEPDVRGELLLQAFTYAQLRMPSALVLVILGTLRRMRPSVAFVRELRHAFRRGEATAPLVTFRWEDHWATPVTELRRLLSCPS